MASLTFLPAVSASLSRRKVLRAAAAAVGAASLGLHAQTARPIRIGYQKFNTLNILKGTGNLDKALAPRGVKVEWHEFLGGGQLSEALAADAIDFGHASDGIGVFQQASNKGLAYIAAETPYPRGVGFLVPKNSPFQSIRDLKGRRVATGRGYNTQYILIRALEANGLTYQDIDPVYIVTAADTVAALQAGSVSAIGLWDPFLASAQVATDSRLLFDGTGLTANRTYHLAKPDYARQPGVAARRVRRVAERQRLVAGQSQGAGRHPGAAAECRPQGADAGHRAPPIRRGAAQRCDCTGPATSGRCIRQDQADSAPGAGERCIPEPESGLSRPGPRPATGLRLYPQ